ncbi:hypothetical protein ACOACO_10560 [Nocardioides sp. CPCC 205120]|uniref:hypothetical protein n=1 Tax=Nocardioides sp. CPCC 205120 TaxID=3406462 RepID=UPI003B50193D
MTGDPDWSLDDATLAALQFTEWAESVDVRRRRDFLDGYPGDGDAAWRGAEARAWVKTVKQDAKRYGCKPGFVPWPWPMVTAAGRLELDRVRALRQNGRARRIACRDAIVLWLADVGEVQEVAQFVAEGPCDFYGTAFEPAEVSAAAAFLEGEGLIKGIKTWGPELLLASLTARGQACADYHNGNVQNYLNPQPAEATMSVHNSQNFHGPVSGQVAQGQTVNQTQHQGLDAAALEKIFRAMRDALADVDDPGLRDVAERAIGDLEGAVQRGDTDDVVARARGLERLAGLVGSTALTTATSTGVTQLLQAVGLS